LEQILSAVKSNRIEVVGVGENPLKDVEEHRGSEVENLVSGPDKLTRIKELGEVSVGELGEMVISEDNEDEQRLMVVVLLLKGEQGWKELKDRGIDLSANRWDEMWKFIKTVGKDSVKQKDRQNDEGWQVREEVEKSYQDYLRFEVIERAVEKARGYLGNEDEESLRRFRDGFAERLDNERYLPQDGEIDDWVERVIESL